MSAPIQHRPFNLEHARAGAPIATRSGLGVDILKWDRKATMPIIGILNDGPSTVVAWNIEGSNLMNESYHLVMTPLGYIDGKPVFAGDHLVTPTGMQWIATPTCRGGDRSLGDCHWPAPAKVYPESTMNPEQMADEFADEQDRNAPGAYKRGLTRVANAVLRHAIDAGQVILKADADAVMAELSKSVADELASRAARDMAVAEAVRDATYVKVMNCHPGHEGTVVRQLDLAAIIAGVKS